MMLLLVIVSLAMVAVEGQESRLDNFFRGVYQRGIDKRQQVCVAKQCRTVTYTTPAGVSVAEFGICRSGGCNAGEVYVDGVNTPNWACANFENCDCKCCIPETTDLVTYPCLSNPENDDCRCKHKGICRPHSADGNPLCENGERAVDNQNGLCSINCACCKIIDPHGGTGGSGDPHFQTFDHFKYEHTGDECTYILFKECVEYPSFLVAVKYEGFTNDDNKYRTRISDVLVKVKPYLIQLGSRHVVYVNGVYQSLPWTDGDTITIRKADERHTKLDVAGKFNISWNGFSTFQAGIDESLHGNVCGMLGNADDDPSNDLHIQGDPENVTTDIEEIGRSWMVPGSCSKLVNEEEIKYLKQERN